MYETNVLSNSMFFIFYNLKRFFITSYYIRVSHLFNIQFVAFNLQLKILIRISPILSDENVFRKVRQYFS